MGQRLELLVNCTLYVYVLNVEVVFRCKFKMFLVALCNFLACIKGKIFHGVKIQALYNSVLEGKCLEGMNLKNGDCNVIANFNLYRRVSHGMTNFSLYVSKLKCRVSRFRHAWRNSRFYDEINGGKIR